MSELEIITKALDLSVQSSKKTGALQNLKKQCFKSKPAEPVNHSAAIAKPPYPNIVSNRKLDIKKSLMPFFIAMASSMIFSTLSVLFSFFGILSMIAFFAVPVTFAYFIYYYFAIYKKLKQADVEQIRNSAEYQNQCAAIDSEYAQKVQAENQRYEAACKTYQEVTLPEYNQALQTWTEQHNAEVEKLQKELDALNAELKQLYDTTKILPTHYRSIQALTFIQNTLETSQYDVRTAIEMYDRDKQMRLDRAKLEEQRIANQQAATQNALLDEQNALMDEQNTIAEKSRRDANIAAAVGAIQRHNTNRYLKKK